MPPRDTWHARSRRQCVLVCLWAAAIATTRARLNPTRRTFLRALTRRVYAAVLATYSLIALPHKSHLLLFLLSQRKTFRIRPWPCRLARATEWNLSRRRTSTISKFERMTRSASTRTNIYLKGLRDPKRQRACWFREQVKHSPWLLRLQAQRGVQRHAVAADQELPSRLLQSQKLRRSHYKQ